MSEIPAGERNTASVGSLVAGNSGFLFLSFAASALMNALPQIFYARYASGHRVLWLSLSLFLSAIFSLLGNRAVQATVPLFRSAAAFYATGGGTMALCLVCAYQTGIPVPLYFSCQLVLAFVMACFLQLLDRYLSESAGEIHRHRNDLLTNLFRFVGMLLGPFWFWLFAPGTLPAMLGTLVFSFSMILCLFGVKAGEIRQLQPETAGKQSAFFELLFLCFAVMVYATYCLLSASLAYLLTELSGQDANRQAILLIVIIFASAAGFTAICLAFNVHLNRRMIVFAPVVIAFAGQLLPLMLNNGCGCN